MLQLDYYSNPLQFILGSDQWLGLTGKIYTKGHFDLVITKSQATVVFVADDPAHFIGETTFDSVLSPFTLKLVHALIELNGSESLNDLDYDLILAIDSKIDSDLSWYTSDQQFIDLLNDFSRFDGASYLVSTEEIAKYVLTHSDSYADFIETVPSLPVSPTGNTVRSLLSRGLYSAAEYLYFKVTPLIIKKYINAYKSFLIARGNNE